MDYLNKKVDIFSSPTSLEVFLNSFPILMECMKKVLLEENSSRMENIAYLPNDVSAILKNMIKLRFGFDMKSLKTAVARTSPHSETPVTQSIPWKISTKLIKSQTKLRVMTVRKTLVLPPPYRVASEQCLVTTK